MIKTQVQIPDHLVREARRIAEQYEMSFAEVVRRGLERLIPTYPPRPGSIETWQLPTLDLGLVVDPFADPEWRSALYGADSEVVEPPGSAAPKPRGAERSRRAPRRNR
jgi:hypothetical protein